MAPAAQIHAQDAPVSPAPSVIGPEITAQPYPDVPPGFVIRAAIWLRKRVLDLAHLLAPPEIKVFELASGVIFTEMLTVVARHDIAERLAAGPRSAAELAAATGLDAEALHRVLRGLASAGVFTLGSDGRFANNRYSQALLRDRLSHMREYALYFGSDSNLRAWRACETAVRTGKSPFARVHGKSVWDWFDEHPEERETFAAVMMGMTIADAPIIARLYPWHEVQRVCDVGGGRGTLLSELLVRHPHLHGILCDGAGVVEQARQLVARRGLQERMQLCAGSFFAEVPIGADAYLLKNILHDWDDARCLQILGVVRKAMKPGARLVLCESLQERNDSSGLAALADVHMLMVCDDGRERSRAELAALLAKSGFRPGRVLPGPTVSVIEGIAE